MIRGLGVLICFLVIACSTAPKKTGHASEDRPFLFPMGIYRHKISLVTAKGPQTPRKFDGVVSLKDNSIQVHGLSGFGVTAFKITEDRKSGDIQIDVFIAALERFRPKMKDYYMSLRELLTTSMNNRDKSDIKRQLDSKGRLVKIERAQESYEFSNYDEQGIPQEFVIHHPEFTAVVKVVGYDI